MKFTLRQLQIFLAVAKYQNISKAAQSLHMSQSAANEALLNLEHTYTVTLFDRVSNKLALNAIGHTLRKETETRLAWAPHGRTMITLARWRFLAQLSS